MPSLGSSPQLTRNKSVVDPNEKFPQVDVNWFYLDQLARSVVEWGYPATAVPLARVTAEMYAQTARAYTTLGLTLAATGDTRGASAAYAKALEIDPSETRALELRRRLPR